MTPKTARARITVLQVEVIRKLKDHYFEHTDSILYDTIKECSACKAYNEYLIAVNQLHDKVLATLMEDAS